MRTSLVVGILAFASQASAQPLSWGLYDGNESWPAGQRDTISKSMNEAVGLYNQYGTFEKHVTANYNAGVPTAEGNYDGFISFGGLNNTRTALHEIAHTLGVGTYRPFNGGTWDEKGAAGKLLKLFDGQAATISTGGTHFWPYGLNYDSEDGPAARERHCKLVAALRFDMGIVGDSDKDGMPDDWEQLQFGDLKQGGSDDPDHDGIPNVDEYSSDSDPNVACPVRDGHSYIVRTQASERVLTVQTGVQVTSYLGNPVQHWTARYVGAGFWRFENGGKVLQMDGSDTADGRALSIASQSDALSQQWRVVGGVGAKQDFWQIANRETGRVADCSTDCPEDAVVHQWQYVGNAPQQFWSFEDLDPDATTARDGGTRSDVGADAGATVRDAGLSVRDAGVDAGRSGVDASISGQADDPSGSKDGGGCSLTTRTDASALLLALAMLLRRRRR